MKALGAVAAFTILLVPACAEDAGAKREITVTIGDAKIVLRLIRPATYKINYPDFYMQETEVTNLQFKQYLADTKKTKDDSAVLKTVSERDKPATEWKCSTADIPYSVDDAGTIWKASEFPAGQESFPVTLVTLLEAQRFCAWLSEKHPDAGVFRLPTWNEWMVAAYGRERKYPWGDTWDVANAHTSYGHDCKEILDKPDYPKRTEPVTARAKGRTPEGLYGMIGNAAEFIHPDDPTNDGYFNCGARWMGGGYKQGAGWPSKKEDCMPARKDYWGYSHYPILQQCDLGFRVMLDTTRNPDLVKRRRMFDQNDKSWMTKKE
jgi:formylglycine-generating enzyme required for sulfatase activity